MTVRRRVLAAALLLTGCSPGAAEPAPERPTLGLITALPLLWGEADIDELLAGGGQRAPAIERLGARYTIEPVDAVAPATLAQHRLLLIAQPPVPSPHELVALDDWVRAGGRALILADPLLAWDSRYALGDPRRPPPVQPLGRLLAHWGLVIDPPADGATEMTVGNRTITTTTPGRIRRVGGSCSVEAGLARCRLGAGEVAIVPDADLIDAEQAGGALEENLAVVDDLLASLAPPDGTRKQASDSGS